MEQITSNLISYNSHPIMADKVTRLCDARTSPKDYCELLADLTMLMGYEALKDLKTKDVTIKAPTTEMTAPVLSENITIVPVLRGGLGMVEGLRRLLPYSKIGYIGMKRDEDTLCPSSNYCQMPSDLGQSKVVIVDQVMSTGGSIDATVKYLKKNGCTDITVICIFASDVGVKNMNDKHCDVKIHVARYIPEGLSEKGRIDKCGGDAGDRISGTEFYIPLY